MISMLHDILLIFFKGPHGLFPKIRSDAEGSPKITLNNPLRKTLVPLKFQPDFFVTCLEPLYDRPKSCGKQTRREMEARHGL